MVAPDHKIYIVDASLEDPEDDESGIRKPATIKFVSTEDSSCQKDFSVVDLSSVMESGSFGFQSGGASGIRNSKIGHNYHFAVSGKSWSVIRNHFPYLLHKIIQRGTVFAR